MRRFDFVSAAIIVSAVLLCIFLSYLGAGKEIGEKVAPAAAVFADPAADPLLVLVNDGTPLSENWQVTPRMVDDEVVDLRMYDDYIAMYNAAAREEVWLWVASGYRSVEEQKLILERAVQENMALGMSRPDAEEKALRTIARPGHSEHHTGLAIDLNDVSDDFETSAAYRWLCAHAAEYGFVQRYRGDKAAVTGIDNESWHYRYLGREHALLMQELDLCLEEYVEYLRNGRYL